MAMASPCLAQDAGTFGAIFELEAPEADHGRITVGYQSVHTDGNVDDDGDPAPGLRTDTHSLLLAFDYRFAEDWSLNLSLPYIVKRSLDDPGVHNPALLVPPQEGDFIDDGDWHGAWQDWQLGVTYHGQWHGFDVLPHAVLTWPSHDYTFFASAAPGRYLRSLRLGADVSRRFGHTNLFWSAGYSYEFVEEVLDMNLDKQHYRLSMRWDVSPTWSLGAFAFARYSNGIQAAELRGQVPHSELWHQHDRLLQQDYVLAGVRATWRFSDRWALSGSTAWPVQAESMHRVNNAWDLVLTRDF